MSGRIPSNSGGLSALSSSTTVSYPPCNGTCGSLDLRLPRKHLLLVNHIRYIRVSPDTDWNTRRFFATWYILDIILNAAPVRPATTARTYPDPRSPPRLRFPQKSCMWTTSWYRRSTIRELLYRPSIPPRFLMNPCVRSITSILICRFILSLRQFDDRTASATYHCSAVCLSRVREPDQLVAVPVPVPVLEFAAKPSDTLPSFIASFSHPVHVHSDSDLDSDPDWLQTDSDSDLGSVVGDGHASERAITRNERRGSRLWTEGPECDPPLTLFRSPDYSV